MEVDDKVEGHGEANGGEGERDVRVGSDGELWRWGEGVSRETEVGLEVLKQNESRKEEDGRGEGQGEVKMEGGEGGGRGHNTMVKRLNEKWKERRSVQGRGEMLKG